MKLDRRKTSGREKDERAVRLLGQLREKLYSEHVAVARRAAFNLSWMQEDGLEVLKEALFSNAARRTKTAAAYGLRKMHGRMKKMASDALSEGLKHVDSTIVQVCENALSVLEGAAPVKASAPPKTKAGRFEIRQVAPRGRQRRTRVTVARQRDYFRK